MFSLIKTLSTLFTPSLDDVQQRHERFLADAVDMCDLEQRIRRLDGGRAGLDRTGAHGVFTS
jgi:hypothetical protein